MKPLRPASTAEAARFRRRLLLAMMLVVAGSAAVALYFARQSIAREEQQARQQRFEAALGSLHQARQVRHAALVERTRALARKPRIVAALEDGALDLLYLNADDELRDVLASHGAGAAHATHAWHARFYRFLDQQGDVIPPDNSGRAGAVDPELERKLHLPRLPAHPQVGYAAGPEDGPLHELLATSIHSSENGEPIAALVLGFPPLTVDAAQIGAEVRSGVYYDGRLFFPDLAPAAAQRLEQMLSAEHRLPSVKAGDFQIELAGEPVRVFFQQLNPDSIFAPAYEVCVFPLARMLERQEHRSWQILGAAALLLLGSFGASHVVASRFAVPVARWVDESAEERQERKRAEAALVSTHVELERTARFSANASHQLKTPVAVLRSGLEELLAKLELTPAQCDEISALIHQTYRLSSIIEDLLLLSRIDAGQLKIRFGSVDLSRLIEASLDDLGALPEEAPVEVETDLPPALAIAGEKRYVSLILQNLLENARKYNRPGGRIRILARQEGDAVYIRIANTSVRPIPPEEHAHIFERFHRAALGANVPGYGLGLNLARELARIHEGDLQLVRSDGEWTELEARFRAAGASPMPAGPPPEAPT